MMVRNIPRESGVILLCVEYFTEEEKILKEGKSQTSIIFCGAYIKSL
jgi:hypothetical protein